MTSPVDDYFADLQLNAIAAALRCEASAIGLRFGLRLPVRPADRVAIARFATFLDTGPLNAAVFSVRVSILRSLLTEQWPTPLARVIELRRLLRNGGLRGQIP